MKLRLAVLLSLLILPAFADLAGFDFRQNVSVDFGFIHGEYMALIPVNTQTLISGGKLQSDCADLRFTKTDDTLYEIWEDIGCNTASTQLTVRLNQSIAIGNTTVLMYYGNAIASSVSDFNATFSTAEVPNGGFEGDSTGANPATYVITEGGVDGIVNVNETIAYDLNHSVFILDNSGGAGDSPNMERSFAATSNTSIVEFMINVGAVAGDHFLGLLGDASSVANVQTWAFKANTTISIWDGNVETFTNCSWVADEWLKFQMTANFSNDKNKLWLNDSFCGEFDFRENAGEANDMDVLSFTFSSVGTGYYHIDAVRLRPFEDPEPSVFFGSEENFQTASLTATPSTIAFTEQTNLTISAGATFNLTEFFWTFGDGNTTFTTVPSINHTYISGGIFNASVIALNVSNNVTAFTNVTVISPEVRIWAEDNSTGQFLQNFSIIIANSTASANLSTTSFFVNFSAEDQPYGDVTLDVLATGFNHTPSSFSTISTSLINRTEQLFPAVVTLFTVSHQTHFNATRIPAKVEISNSTTLITFLPTEEENFNFDCDACGVDQLISNIGFFWKYKVEDLGASAATATLFLCDQFAGNCDNIRDLSGLDEENYLILQDDGAWEIRSTADASLFTGTFGFVPARMKIIATVGGGEHVKANITEMQVPYVQCFINSGCPTGNVTIKIIKPDTGVFDDIDAYQNTYISLLGVTSTSILNKTAYFQTSDLGFATNFIVFNRNTDTVQGAKVTIFRQDGEGNLFEIASAFTDASGTTPTMYFEKLSTVFVFAESGLLNTGSVAPVNINENNLDVSLRLNEFAFVADDPAFAGVTITLSPTDGSTVRDDTSQFFNLTVSDSDSLLENTTYLLSSTSLNFSFFNSSASASLASFSQLVVIPELNTSATITLFYTITRNSTEINNTITWTVIKDVGLSQYKENADLLDGFAQLLALIFIVGGYQINLIIGTFIVIIAAIIEAVSLDVAFMAAILGIGLTYSELRR